MDASFFYDQPPRDQRIFLNAIARLALALILIGAAAKAWAMTKCVDAQGRVSYSDTLCPTRVLQAQDDAGSGRKITKREVEAMIAASDQAQRRFDVDAMMSFFADDAQIEVVVRSGHRTGRRALRKPELAVIAKRHRDDFTDYKFQRQNTLIEISPNGMQAEVRSTLIETWRSGGQMVTMTSEEQDLLELRNGKLRVVQAYSITDGGPREIR